MAGRFYQMNVFLIVFFAISAVYGEDKINPYDFLVNYGYLQPNAFSSIKNAIKDMQRFASLPPTGVVDDATRKLMNTPRCGLPDIENFGYYYGSRKWTKSDLTYRVENYTPDLESSEVDRIMKEAFQLWADYIPLRFTQINQPADFSIVFGRYRHKGGWGKNGEGTCNARFDGSGGVLAHAYFPPDGRCHFDESETFTDKTYRGTNLFWVAAHEFGHALGLSHSRVRGALMYPYYTGYKENFYLPDDDIRRITALYGHRGTLPPGQTYPPRPSRGPTRVIPTGSGNCFDKKGERHCKARSSVCNTKHDGWRTYMKINCQRTCGYCTGTAPEETEPPHRGSVPTWQPTPVTLKPSKEPEHTTRKLSTKATEVTKVTGAACVDKAGSYCINHVKNGKCAATDDVWKSYMRRNCFKSCFC